MFKKKFKLEAVDFDYNGNIKITSLFKIIQDVACLGADYIGCGIHTLINKGLMWVILKQRVVIEKQPKIGDTLTFYTYPGKQNKFLYFRHIFAKDNKGNVVIRYISEWAILKLDSRHLALPSETKISPKQYSYKDELKDILPIQIEKEDLIESRMVRYSDIDINKHLNNVKYIEYVLDSKGSDFFNNKHIKEVQFNYLKEIKEKEIVELYESSDNPLIIEGKVNGNKMFVSKIVFNK